jgi:hypothetical protein
LNLNIYEKKDVWLNGRKNKIRNNFFVGPAKKEEKPYFNHAAFEH